jgi:hypothetical protein
MPSPAPTPLVAAVGIPLGVVSVDDPDSIGPGLVAASGRLVELSVDSYLVWASAVEPRTAGEICESAAELGVPNAGPLIDELFDHGLAVELPDPDNISAWASRVRLAPQGLGLGNTGDDREVFLIGDRSGEKVIGVDVGTYYLWGLCGSTVSLAAALDAVVVATDIPLEWLHERICGVLPELLRWRVVVLDRL